MRFCLLILAAAAQLVAATRVSDILYDGVGTRFGGACAISWDSFVTADLRAITGGSRTLVIRGGVLDLMLEPTAGATPRMLYRVQCAASGLGAAPVEWWDVPVSSTPLRLIVVRYATGGSFPAPSGTAGFADAEVPAAVIGVARNFDLTHAPAPPASLVLIWNGLTLRRNEDYLLVGRRVYFTTTYYPSSPGELLAFYRW